MAPLMIVLATILGGGSLCLFGLFLLLGPFELLPLGWTEPWALVWDSFLSLVFFAQHSTMLRPSFRDRLAEHLPTRYHGALYSITSGLALTGVVLLWQCSPTMLCRLDGLPRLVTRALFILAAGGMAWGASVLHSFDPLGLQAIRAHGRNRESPAPRLAIRGPYRWVRHPLYSFSIVMIWSHPDFSVTDCFSISFGRPGSSAQPTWKKRTSRRYSASRIENTSAGSRGFSRGTSPQPHEALLLGSRAPPPWPAMADEGLLCRTGPTNLMAMRDDFK